MAEHLIIDPEEDWADELKIACPDLECKAPVGKLCFSTTVFIHFERFRLAEALKNSKNRPALPIQLRIPGF